MFFNSGFNHSLHDWHPKKLKHTLNIFKNCPAPIPYWAQVEVEFIPKTIEVYQLQQSLQQNLSNELTSCKNQVKTKKYNMKSKTKVINKKHLQ